MFLGINYKNQFRLYIFLSNINAFFLYIRDTYKLH